MKKITYHSFFKNNVIYSSERNVNCRKCLKYHSIDKSKSLEVIFFTVFLKVLYNKEVCRK